MTEDEVQDLLKRALEAVDGAGIEGDLREVAFTSALAMLRGDQPAPGAPPAATPAGETPPAARPSDLSRGSSSTTMLDKVAAGLDLPPDKIQRLFAEKDGAPELIVKATKLPKSKAGAAHDISLLTMAARQLGGLEDYTETGVLRDTTKRYGKFDSKNFGTQMRSLDNLILTDGKGANAKRKLTQPGLEAAAELAKKYLEEG